MAFRVFVYFGQFRRKSRVFQYFSVLLRIAPPPAIKNLRLRCYVFSFTNSYRLFIGLSFVFGVIVCFWGFRLTVMNTKTLFSILQFGARSHYVIAVIISADSFRQNVVISPCFVIDPKATLTAEIVTPSISYPYQGDRDLHHV